MVPRTLNVNDGCLLAFLHLPASLQSCHDFLSVSCVICAFCFHLPATCVQDVLEGQEAFLWCLQLSNTATSWNLCVWLCAQCFCLKTVKPLSPVAKKKEKNTFWPADTSDLDKETDQGCQLSNLARFYIILTHYKNTLFTSDLSFFY